jgi:hypothetical protein
VSEQPLRRPWSRRAPRPLPPAPGQPQRHPHRGGRQGHLPTPALPLRSGQDRDVPQALPRHPARAPSGVWRILNGWSSIACRPPSGTSAMTGAGSAMRSHCPATRVQLDVKLIEPLAGSRRKHYQFTAIDDCTRLRVLRIYPQLNQKSAIQFLDYVLERLPFRVEVIQTDNGVEFGSASIGMCWTRAWAMSTSSPAPRGSTARSSAPTASTPRSSTACWTGW